MKVKDLEKTAKDWHWLDQFIQIGFWMRSWHGSKTEAEPQDIPLCEYDYEKVGNMCAEGLYGKVGEKKMRILFNKEQVKALIKIVMEAEICEYVPPNFGVKVSEEMEILMTGKKLTKNREF